MGGRSCAASTWSSAIRSRRRGRRAGSFRRNCRSTCPILPWPIPRTESRRASASRLWPTASACASPSVQESRSMADKEDKKAGDKAPKGDKPPRQDKGQQAQQKGDKGQQQAK